jgi:hypothetical protein
MITAQMEKLESEVDGLGVSSLVVDLGGFGAIYPTSVSDSGGMRFVIETAIHEWVHQYLAFRPLGFRYVLDGIGIVKDSDIVTLNETVAGITAKELADDLIATYYPQLNKSAPAPPSASGFDFNQTMKDIRRAVDVLLTQGKVSEATAYMEQQRRFLQTKGFYIRKLNQAYFAFNGIYADSPTSIDPLGDQVRELRDRRGSLKEFLASVSVMTARQDVVNAIR